LGGGQKKKPITQKKKRKKKGLLFLRLETLRLGEKISELIQDCIVIIFLIKK